MSRCGLPAPAIAPRVPTPPACPLASSLTRSEFLEAVVSTLRLEGTVLIPVDTAGRALELLLLLEHHWCVRVPASGVCGGGSVRRGGA